MDWQSTLMEPLQSMWTQILAFIPLLISVIIVLVVGLLFASLAQKLLTRFLKLARLDTISEKSGISAILAKGDINYTLSEIIGVLVYWVLALIVVLLAVNVLQLDIAANLLNQVILYMPNVIAGVFILILGIFFANVVSNSVRTACANAGIAQARTLAQTTQVVILTFAIIEALKQLRIDTTIIDMALKAMFAALALGLGLAIGLGCKDIAGKYVNQLIDSFKPKK